MPTVSVLVPVRNEGRSIEATLRSLLTQDYPPDQFEVIVADGLSDDDTVPRVRRLQAEFPNLKLVYNPARLASAGRNAAARHMTGEVAVVVDGHCHVPDRHYLRNVAAAFDRSKADCLGRPQPLDVPDPTPFQAAVSLARSSRLGHNPGSDIYSDQPKWVEPQSTAVAYRRGVFHRVGLFDERFDACEDVEFNTRVHAAGLGCYFCPTLAVVYEPRRSWAGVVKQLGRYGGGAGAAGGQAPEVAHAAGGGAAAVGGLAGGRGRTGCGAAAARLGVRGERAAVHGGGARRGWLAGPWPAGGRGGAGAGGVRRHPPGVRMGLPAGGRPAYR